MKRALVIAPHPDDETLGCGGTLLKLRDKEFETFWVIFTKADESLGISSEWLGKRENEIKLVSEKYGFSDVFKLNFLTTKLDTIPMSEMVGKLSKIIQKVKPNIVFLNHPHDIHSDHKVVFQVSISTLKTFRASFVEKILACEIITETDQSPAFKENAFVPNVFVDITPYIEEKLEIMSIYESEVMKYPLPRSLDSIKSLARYRGSTIGVEYAEAFELIRERWK